MKIFVKNIVGQMISLDLEASDTIGAVKEKIKQADAGFSAKSLIYAGKALDDKKTLSDYNIKEENTVIFDVSK